MVCGSGTLVLYGTPERLRSSLSACVCLPRMDRLTSRCCSRRGRGLPSCQLAYQVMSRPLVSHPLYRPEFCPSRRSVSSASALRPLKQPGTSVPESILTDGQWPCQVVGQK